MYILIVARGYPSEKYKMNGIFEFDQAKALVEAGHKVIYAAIDVRSLRRTRKWGFESFKREGVQVEAINLPCGRIPKNILNRISRLALRNLYKKILIKYGEPDIIHAHFIGSGYITTHLFSESKIPLVLTEHFSGMNKNHINPHLSKLGNYTYPRMDKVIAVSEYLAKNIKEKFDVEAIVIPNIVDTTSFEYKYMKKNKDFFNFVSTGNLLPNKRMDILIEAFYNAFKGDKKVNLYIYGEGPERNKLEKLINAYGLTGQVFLMGLVDRKEIANKMSESDCFVLASRLETFGVAYIEAMAMGLPVIATKCGGPEDFITEENGILVPVDDVDELEKTLRTIHINADLYDRKTISDAALKKYSSETIANRLFEIYENLLKLKRIRK